MEIYVDSADLEAISKVAGFFPIDGITTNPNILSQCGYEQEEIMPKLHDFAEQHNTRIFVQVTGSTAEEMSKQAAALKKYFGNRLILKIPAIPEGYKAVPICKEQGIEVCVTVVHSMMQGFIAAKAGADYIAPYITHIDNDGADGVGTVKTMMQAIQFSGYKCKVLGASFRTVDQIIRLAAIGCDAVTITPDMYFSLIAHASTNQAMDKFVRTWESKFGNKQVTDLLP